MSDTPTSDVSETKSLHDRIAILELWIERLFAHTDIEKPAAEAPSWQAPAAVFDGGTIEPITTMQPPAPGIVADVDGVPHQYSSTGDDLLQPTSPEASHTLPDQSASGPQSLSDEQQHAP